MVATTERPSTDTAPAEDLPLVSGAPTAAYTNYRAAAARMTAVIERRAASVRNLIVALIVIVATSATWAIVARSLSPIAAALLIFPVCAFFFYADARLLGEWHDHVTRAWASRELDFVAFRDLTRANKGLPAETTEAMLAMLPQPSQLARERRVHTVTRQAVAVVSACQCRRQSDRLALTAASSAIAAASVTLSVWMSSARPLLVAVPLVALPVAQTWMRRRRDVIWRNALDVARRRSGFDEDDFAWLVPDASLGTDARVSPVKCDARSV